MTFRLWRCFVFGHYEEKETMFIFVFGPKNTIRSPRYWGTELCPTGEWDTMWSGSIRRNCFNSIIIIIINLSILIFLKDHLRLGARLCWLQCEGKLQHWRGLEGASPCNKEHRYRNYHHCRCHYHVNLFHPLVSTSEFKSVKTFSQIKLIYHPCWPLFTLI